MSVTSLMLNICWPLVVLVVYTVLSLFSSYRFLSSVLSVLFEFVSQKYNVSQLSVCIYFTSVSSVHYSLAALQCLLL